MLGVGGHLDAPQLRGAAYFVGQHLRYLVLTSLDQLRIGVGADDAEPEDTSRMGGDTSVSEVEAQEEGVCALWQAQGIALADGAAPGVR